MASEVAAKSASASVRVLASGEVYRQKFDAEVQLVKAYEASEEKRKTRENTMATQNLLSENTGIPIVKLERSGPGLLDQRQKSWLQSLPYDNSQENPVLYKFHMSEEKRKHKVSADDHLSQQVQSLPDVVKPAKIGSDIVERIGNSRQHRHDSTFEEMKQEIGIVTVDLEPIIQALCEEVLLKLQGNDKVIEELMTPLDAEEMLLDANKEKLEGIWDEVAQQTVIRTTLIKELDLKLSYIEEQRVERVRTVFSTYAEQLEKISHLTKPELEKLLDAESQLFNQSLLSNKRAYADLNARLLLADADREKRLRTQWRRRHHDWKKLMADLGTSEFDEYMASDYALDPPRAQDIMKSWKAEQSALNQKRLDLIETLDSFGPPASTKTAVIKWNQQLQELTKQINNLNRDYFNSLHKEYEKVCQDCIAEAERIKEGLISSGSASRSAAEEMVREKCLPKVGALQTKFEQHLAEMDGQIERYEEHIQRQLRMLFKFCQGAAHVWDVHEIGLARCERGLQEKLDESRNKHDGENQDREANLDIIMDKMRQEASETALQDSLTKALDMLEKIKESYFKFHGDQLNLVDIYPDMVGDEVTRYDRALCRYFSITRDNPEDVHVAVAPIKPATPPSTVPSNRLRSNKSNTRSSIKSKATEKDEPAPAPSVVSVSTIADVLATTKGTKFYVLTVAPPEGEDVLPPEPQPSEEESHDPYGDITPAQLPTAGTDTGRITVKPAAWDLPDFLNGCNIPDDLLNQIKKHIRLTMLDHLEDWSIKALERARIVVSAKKEELNSELDLRLHLHEPRSRRAEIDVHNVRAAELVLHSERVSRHCKGVVKTLQEVKQQFTELQQDHNRRAVAYRKDVETLETVFTNATKSTSIIKLSSRLQSDQARFMDGIRESLRNFRSKLEATLAGLRDANAKFIKSFKVFSDGGNFCPEELEEYRKKLDRMATRIDLTEGSVLAELEGMESKRLDQAIKILHEFEERFKHHLVDLVFMEKIARWLTNVQVKIKAEVAGSNTEAAVIIEYINIMVKYIDALEKPAADKLTVSPKQLYDSLEKLFVLLDKRANYLEVRKLEPNPPTTAGAKPAGKVNFTGTDGAGGGQAGAGGRADKNKVDDPSIGVIRSIIKTQKVRHGGYEEPPEPAPTKPLVKRTSSYVATNALSESMQTVTASEDGPQGGAQDSKSRLSKRSDGESHYSKKSTANNSASEKRAQSGKGKGIEKKYFIFGEQPLPNEDKVFKGRMMALLREALDGLLANAELYYRQKGTRAVTRPQVMHESFEQCAENVVMKLQSYFKQTEIYHNECLQEFRDQLERLEVLSEKIPLIMQREFSKIFMDQLDTEQEAREKDFDVLVKSSEKTKKRLLTELRPAVGHPNKQEEMKQLQLEDKQRKAGMLEALEAYSKGTLERLVECGQDYLVKAGRLMEEIMFKFDTLITIDDVIKGHKPKSKYPTSELMRRHLAHRPLEDVDLPEMIPRGQHTWDGLPKNELTVPGIAVRPREGSTKVETKSKKRGAKRDPQAQSHTAPVVSSKTTLGHHGAYKGRAIIYQEFQHYFKSLVERVEDTRQKHLKLEDEWEISWNTSVTNIKELY